MRISARAVFGLLSSRNSLQTLRQNFYYYFYSPRPPPRFRLLPNTSSFKMSDTADKGAVGSGAADTAGTDTAGTDTTAGTEGPAQETSAATVGSKAEGDPKPDTEPEPEAMEVDPEPKDGDGGQNKGTSAVGEEEALGDKGESRGDQEDQAKAKDSSSDGKEPEKKKEAGSGPETKKGTAKGKGSGGGGGGFGGFFRNFFSSSKPAQRRGREYYEKLPIEEKRKFYRCKEKYLTLDQIETWSVTRDKLKVKPEKSEPPYSPAPHLDAKVSLWQGDITHLEIDAIVNAANSSLLGGGGVDGAIHRAAGDSLYDECLTLNGCETGNTKLSSGHRLPAKYILHTVGPIDGSREKLQGCYNTCFELVLKNKIRSVAFCCIATGIYGYPNAEAAEVALTTTRNWLEQHSDQVDRVIFCVFLEKDLKIYQKKLGKFFPPQKGDDDEGTSVDKESTEEKTPTGEGVTPAADEQASQDREDDKMETSDDQAGNQSESGGGVVQSSAEDGAQDAAGGDGGVKDAAEGDGGGIKDAAEGDGGGVKGHTAEGGVQDVAEGEGGVNDAAGGEGDGVKDHTAAEGDGGEMAKGGGTETGSGGDKPDSQDQSRGGGGKDDEEVKMEQ